MNKARSPSQYQDGDNMSYSEKEGLKQLPEASSWPKFSGTGGYDHMKLIYYIYRLFIDVPSIPDYWITARLNTEFKGKASILYTEMKEIHGRRNWPWWKNQIIQKYSNDHYANNCPKSKKKVYAIEKVPEEEAPTEDSESDSIGDPIRGQSDKEQEPREEFLVEYQEETPLEIRTYSWKQACHKRLPIVTCENIQRMHKHSWSHQPKEGHTYMGQPQR
ncbi:hypothetical protein O181_010628 [Austropuccinia psidii MF-1]|uniref:Uncharacterized protein n=1 Tax=Austropuccinia psidii MF-1 TaxID=1389203 RepID=A0A9Q3BTD1_9BASI|nr:hypothetical protein [Austropuccinia psidii MF-1]